MSIASELHARACELVDQRSKDIAKFERELSEIEHRKVAIESQLKFALLAVERLRKFSPTLGPNYQCPDCFIKDETRSALRPIPGSATHDLFRCETCGIEHPFPV